MKVRQKLPPQMVQRVNQQLAQLSSHPHIKKIQRQSQRSFVMVYTPLTAKSAYRQKSYSVQLILPQDYPQNAPRLQFIDQIYHLNIGFNSGEVRMAVLEDDWSPFLSLTSIIESLDQLMDSPEEDYAVEHEVLQLYQNQKKKYEAKVVQNVQLCDVVLCCSNQRAISSKDINGSGVQINKFGLNSFSPTKKGKSSILIEQLRKSMEYNDMNDDCEDEIEQYDGAKNAKFPKMVRAQSKQQNAFNDTFSNNKNEYGNPIINNTKRAIKKQSMQMERQKIQIIGQARSKKATKSKTLPHYGYTNSTGEHPTLLHINQTISMFIQQVSQLQEQMNLTSSSSIKQLLQEKYQSQMAMLKELLEMSQLAKRKILAKIRMQIDSM